MSKNTMPKIALDEAIDGLENWSKLNIDRLTDIKSIKPRDRLAQLNALRYFGSYSMKASKGGAYG